MTRTTSHTAAGRARDCDRGRRHAAAASGADLSEPPGHAGGAVPGRRRQRRAGAAGRRADEQDARPAGRGGEPRRRRRHGRDPRDREEPARRPHHPALLHRHVRHQSDALSQCRLRSAQGFRRDRLDRDADQRAGVASVAAGEIDRRPDRLRQSQSRQDQLRLRARNRRATSRPRCSRAAPASSSPTSPTRATATPSPT